MNPEFRPLLGVSMFLSRENRWRSFDEIPEWPVLATPKLDGIRIFTTNVVPSPGDISTPVCRSMKILPNYYAKKLIAQLPPGLDGEGMTRDMHGKLRPFNGVQSDLMSTHGTPEVEFHVFDYIQDVDDPYCYEEWYQYRVQRFATLDLPDFCHKILPVAIHNSEDLRAFEEKCLSQGYEGICFRSPRSAYKFGRSTWMEQCLVKVKRFLDAEGVIVGFEELMSNQNAPTRNELGYQERSSHQSGMVAMNTLGNFIIQSSLFNETFRVGTGPGLTDLMRKKYWDERESLLGRHVTFKYQSHGTKDRPRIPGFVGLRSTYDMTAVQKQLL